MCLYCKISWLHPRERWSVLFHFRARNGQHKILLSRFFNEDETGTTIWQHKNSKFVGLKVRRWVAGLSWAERGAPVTVVTCISAPSQFAPPLLVFPRKNVRSELLDGAHHGTIGICHISGRIQAKSFTQWFRHFFSCQSYERWPSRFMVRRRPDPDEERGLQHFCSNSLLTTAFNA